MGVLREQRDGLLLSLLSFVGDAFTCLNFTFAAGIGGGEGLPLLSSLTRTHTAL
jgi:hypothetical protein